MEERPARRPARQRDASEQVPVTSTPDEPTIPGLAEPSGDFHDPGGWLVIGLMVLMMVAVGAITVLTWQAA